MHRLSFAQKQRLPMDWTQFHPLWECKDGGRPTKSHWDSLVSFICIQGFERGFVMGKDFGQENTPEG
jgi:hypothetical protein